jgi:hypothetical protein
MGPGCCHERRGSWLAEATLGRDAVAVVVHETLFAVLGPSDEIAVLLALAVAVEIAPSSTLPRIAADQRPTRTDLPIGARENGGMGRLDPDAC